MKKRKWDILRDKILRERKARSLQLWLKAIAVVFTCMFSFIFVVAAYSFLYFFGRADLKDTLSVYVSLATIFIVAVVLVKRHMFPDPA